MRAPVTLSEGMEKVERKKDERRGLCGCDDETAFPPEQLHLKSAVKDEL